LKESGSDDTLHARLLHSRASRQGEMRRRSRMPKKPFEGEIHKKLLPA
jgi:hypothetical protein